MVTSRGVPAGMLAELAKPCWYPVAMVYLDWPGGAVRWHSNVGDISWDSQTWTGVGAFGEINVPAEVPGLVAAEAGLRLYGVPSTIYDYLDDPIRNRAATIYVGATTVRGGTTLVADPVEIFSGYMDAMSMTEAHREDSGEITLERSVLLTIGSGPGARTSGRVSHSAEDQAKRYPTDTAGRLVIYNQSKTGKITWPQT